MRRETSGRDMLLTVSAVLSLDGSASVHLVPR
jgi:hypothetical protein